MYSRAANISRRKFITASAVIVASSCVNNHAEIINLNSEKKINHLNMKKIISTSKAPGAIGPYSQAVLINGFLYTSGQIALVPESGELITNDIKEETHRVMKNLKAILEEAGMDFSNVIKTGIFLQNMNDFAMVNDVYASYFTSDFPARETVEVARLPKNANVEISMVAFKS